MKVEDFIYDIANTKTYGHVLIDLNNWKSDSVLSQVTLKGTLVPTVITEVIKINPAPAYVPIPFKEGDTIAISSVAARICDLRPMYLPQNPNKYGNVHLSQVLGYFKDGIISIDTFVPLYDKVVMKKVDLPTNTALEIVTDNMSVGEVIAVGEGGFTEEWKRQPMNIKVGSKVLIKDNVTTTLCLGQDEYYVTDDLNIVGEFKSDSYELKDLTLCSDISIFEKYDDERIEGSILFKPIMEEEEIAETYQENLFKLVRSDKFDNGIYYMDRYETEYMKFRSKQYYFIKNEKVMAYRK